MTQSFNPLKPTKHLDLKDINYHNNLMVDHATKLVQSTHKKIRAINENFYSATASEQIKQQLLLDALHQKLLEYDEHLQWCIASSQHAVDLIISETNE